MEAGFSAGRSLLFELFLEAILQFGADFGNFHSCTYQELAAEELMSLVFVRELAYHAAVLAILIPAETPIGNRFWADVLEAAENCVLFRDLESLPKDLNLHQSFVRAENLICPAGTGNFRPLNVSLL